MELLKSRSCFRYSLVAVILGIEITFFVLAKNEQELNGFVSY